MIKFDRISKIGACFAAPILALAIATAPLPGMNSQSRAQSVNGPASVADLAEGLLDAVVNISTSKNIVGKRPDVPVPNVPDGSPFKDFFEELFPDEKGGKKRRRRSRSSLGSGFVIDSKGLVITNNHVIAGADEIVVNFADGTKLDAELVGTDSKTDIAVLRVKPKKPLTSVGFGKSEDLRIGDWVMAIGNPFGLGGTVTLGIVSAIGRDINSGPYDNFIQTDASINRGNSGGPLFNMNGEVIGINTAIISPTGGSIGLGFSIPSKMARDVVDQLVNFGETRRGWLGVQIQTVTDEIAETLGMAEAKGALVGDVISGGPAADAKLKAGDVILSFNGVDVKEMRDLPRIVADTKVDEKVKVAVLRKGKEIVLDVTVGRLEDGEKKIAATKKVEKKKKQSAVVLGMALGELTDELRESEGIAASVEGVYIAKVKPGSNAADKKVLEGEVIVEVGQTAVKKAGDVTKRLAELKKDNRKNALLMISTKTGDIRFVVLRMGG